MNTMNNMDQIINDVTNGKVLAKEILIEYLVRENVYNICAEYSNADSIIVSAEDPDTNKATIVELRPRADGTFSVITLDSHCKFLKELIVSNFTEAAALTARILKHEADALVEQASNFGGYTDHPFLRDKELIEYLKGFKSYDVPINAKEFNQLGDCDDPTVIESFGDTNKLYDLGNGIWVLMSSSAFKCYPNPDGAFFLNTRDHVCIHALTEVTSSTYDAKTILAGDREIRLSAYADSIAFNDKIYQKMITKDYPNQEKRILDYFKHNQALRVIE